jgi:hypothetical protein
MPNEKEFYQKMIRFYQACQLSPDEIDQVMDENGAQIGRYLVATPELVARKFYQQTFHHPIN